MLQWNCIVAFLVEAVALPAYHFITYSFFYNHISVCWGEMPRNGSNGCLIPTSVCNSLIEVVGHMENVAVTCMFNTNVEDGNICQLTTEWWTLIPNLIYGAGFIVVSTLPLNLWSLKHFDRWRGQVYLCFWSHLQFLKYNRWIHCQNICLFNFCNISWLWILL